MRRLWFARLIVALALLVSTSAPSLASTVSWFCDGRLCGLSLCCCDQPDIKQTDPNCVRTGSDSSERPSICEADCGCTPVITAEREHPSSITPTPAPSALPVFVLAEAPVTPAPLLYTPIVLALLPDYRGPPVAGVSLVPSGLRAPPAS